MTVKERTACILEENRGKYVSGADIAAELGVTRNAVWKAVKSLETEGYQITAVTNRGYCLSENSDVLSAYAIKRYLEYDSPDVRVYNKTTSTNTVLKQLAVRGAAEGTVIAAAEQTEGRGRLGRRFSSDKSGVYFSVLLRPRISAEKSLLITTAAAVAAAETIEEISGKKAEIKWVNDIFIGGKKVCGILTEAAFGMEGGGLDYAVLGIGVNVNVPEKGFPDEIKDIAGAVLDEKIPDARSRLAAGIIDRFFKLYEHIEEASYLEEYRRRSLVIGKNVTLVNGDNREEAFVIGIDDECHLIVKTADGTEKTVSSGEVSVRL